METQYVIGIDEAGRGPLAGPLAVGAVGAYTTTRIEHEHFEKGVRDSKRLTMGKREDVCSWVCAHRELRHAVSMVGPRVVDREGIVNATKLAIARALRRIIPDECRREDVLVLLDGGLRAPDAFVNQCTIIKGDEKEPMIALASIMAKVMRDQKMRALGVRFPEYGFEGHKGYGTKDHYKAIRQFGICASHRKSFLRVDSC